MLLCLLLSVTLVPWSQVSAVNPTPKPSAQPQAQPMPQQQPPHPDCSKLERLRDIHDLNKFQARGDKFDDFDWQLSKELYALEKGNIVISPISLKVVLAMLYEGARGLTAQEIGDALDLANTTSTKRMVSRERFSTILQSLQTSEGAYKIKIGTHVFIDKTAEPNPHYQCKLRLYYNSDMEKVDFGDSAAAVKAINNWARNVTEGHIQDLISEAEAQSSTIMLLLNAVYFKGMWEVPFPENETAPGVFHLDDKQTANVPLMNVTDKFGYYNLSEFNAQMIRLPYIGNKFAMYVLLPNSKTGLDALIKELGPQRPLAGYIANMTFASINLMMPKFEFHFTTSLRSTLEKLGIKTMFTTGAELSDIASTKSGGLVVSNVLQKAGISVTEIGTVAYAATVVELMDKFGGSEDPIEFKADHPFLFFIYDESVKTIVFVGKVTNPDKARVVSSPQETSSPTKKPSGGTESGTNSYLDRFGEEDTTSQSRFNFFDGDLLKEVGKREAGNFVFSPVSVKTLLGLIMEGADGSTRAEIRDLLRLPRDGSQARPLMASLQRVLQKTQNSRVSVDSATKAFLSHKLSFNVSYTKAIKDLYQAEASDVDFTSPESAANKINSWVNTQTRGLIPSLIDADKIDPQTMTILVNAVYFDGKWQKEFLLSDTKEECFYSEPKLDCHRVPMMYKEDELYYKYEKDFDSHIVLLPYQDERFSMVLVIPVKRDGIRELAIDSNRLTFPGLLARSNVREVRLKLPRFSMGYSEDLKQTLTKMGLNEVFTDEAQVPFMINNKQGRVTSIIHKAKIEVSEKGTKASAASGASVVPLMSGLDPVNVTADHPFYYFIYEQESKSVLFAGRVSSMVGESSANDPLDEDIALSPIASQLPSHGFAASPSFGPSSSQPNFLGAQNHQYGPPLPSTTTEQYYDSKGDQIHFPTTNKSANKNYHKYSQQNNRYNKK